jgi:hypothetical protein
MPRNLIAITNSVSFISLPSVVIRDCLLLENHEFLIYVLPQGHKSPGALPHARGSAATTSEPRGAQLFPEALFPQSAIQYAAAQLFCVAHSVRESGAKTADVSWIDDCEPVIYFQSS